MFYLAVENSKNEKLVLSNNPDYQISQIDGLASLGATINTGVITGFDGGVFNSSKTNMRNLGIYLAIQNDVELNRIKLYKYFNIKQWIKLYYKNENRNVFIEGYVEDINIDLFENNQMAQIIILCPQPYFQSVDDIIVSFSNIIPHFEFPFAIDLEIKYFISDPTVLPLEKLKENLLSQTSYLETSTKYPSNFGVTAGNFDGAGISWGAIQYNFGQTVENNTLSPIWIDLINNHPAVCAACFSNQSDYTWWKNLILANVYANLKSFGTNITDPTNSHKVIEPWNTNFTKLGMTPEAIQRQIQAAEWYYTTAVSWKNEFGLWSRRGLSLCYDIAVQSGSISQGTKDLIKADFLGINSDGKTKEQIETEKLIIIANRRSDAVTGEFQTSYRERKLAIANGYGSVYGGTLYLDTVEYDMVLAPAFESDKGWEAIGIPFSTVLENVVGSVPNGGDVDSGLIITIYASDNILNPAVYKADTGEGFTLNAQGGFQMLAGDKVTINTNKGSKQVTLLRNSVKSNVINYMSKNSVWLQLHRGDNKFTYNADSGVNDMIVEITYTNKFVGV